MIKSESSSITISAYAKINLFLDVISKREDGYHNIDGVMQSVSLCDTVTVTASLGDEDIVLRCSDPLLPTDRRNLAYRAAENFKNAFGINGYRIEIDIEKRIPVAAGMAGGSTDCAAVLNALGQIFDIDKNKLFMIAEKLGADVPFCLYGGTAKTAGIGEQLTPATPMPDCYIVIGRKGEGVSTPVAFSRLDGVLGIGREEVRHADLSVMTAALGADVNTLAPTLYNSFEDAIFPIHSGAEEVRRTLKSTDPLTVLLSGSGPSVFAIYNSEEGASAAYRALGNISADRFITRPVRRQDEE
ncbi:MAG: 4-(cytidine 5'-diphospho)-2-C-methyl-D-erythritol kinase [Clostridia bacterium]|nr:4-(cytidine 5'-diphospho)-2-C-methyl-D-erythritol kinase [Clostridia bacterium]